MSEPPPPNLVAVFIKNGQFGVRVIWTGVPDENLAQNVVTCNNYQNPYLTQGTSVLVEQSFLYGITSGDTLNFTLTTQYNDNKPNHVLTTSIVFTDWIPDVPTDVTSSIENGIIVVSWVSGSPCRILRDNIEVASGVYNSEGFNITIFDYRKVQTFTIFALNGEDVSPPATTSIQVLQAIRPPSEPRDLVAIPRKNGALIIWNHPYDSGNEEPIYEITILNQTTLTETTITTALYDNREYRATGLTIGTTYEVTIIARNSLGDSMMLSTQVVPVEISEPDSPLNLVDAYADKSVVLSWTPGDNGGSPITGYRIKKYLLTLDENNSEIVDTEVYTNGDIGNQYVTVATVTGLTYTVTNLTVTRKYKLSVVAINQVGDSLPAITRDITIFGIPSVPLDFRIISADQAIDEDEGQRVVYFKFKPSIYDGGGELSYTLTIFSNGIELYSFDVPLSPFPDANQEYEVLWGDKNFSDADFTFTIHAFNTVFASVPSPIVGPVSFAGVGPTGIPSAPTDITVVPSAASALVSWTPAPSDLAITSYRIYSNPDNKLVNTATADATSLNVTGLKNGTSYTFAVVAINEVGSSYSATCTPSTVPGVPKVTVVGGNGQATLTWLSKPAVGAPITGYTLTCNQTATLPENPTSPVTITGLTNGTSYIFSVTATNIIGTSAAGASKAVIPTSIPDIPTNFAVVALVKSFQVTWEPPVSNGGLAIAEYTITYTRSGITAVAKAKPVTPYSFTVLKLVTGTYSVKMQAKNKLGLSAFTEPITVTVA